MTECKHELRTEECSLCNGKKPPPTTYSTWSRRFKSKYENSACVGCLEPINIGDWIVYNGTYVVHDGCES